MENWLESGFWEKVFQDFVAWAIATLPAVVLILVLLYVLLKTVNVMLSKLKPIMSERMGKDTGMDSAEIEKGLDTLYGIVSSAIKILIWTVGIMLVLKKLGIDIGPIIAGAGVVGLAVGFGAQELVKDFIAGFFMLLENQIRSGDVAIINGTGGLVEFVGLRTVVLRDLSGVVHVFQNGKINSLSNMTKEWSAMVFDIGVAYKEDTDRVVDVMVEVAEGMREDESYKDNILEPMEIFGVDKFDDSAVIVKARLKTKPIQQWSIGREYRRRLKKAFDEKGIEIPFPHRTVYWGAEIDALRIQNQGVSAEAKGD